jgi:hypothetical protein
VDGASGSRRGDLHVRDEREANDRDPGRTARDEGSRCARRITSREPVDGALGGTSFELTFVPPGLRARYARTHVVLVGDRGDRIFHIIDTAPASSAPHDDLVATLVASFREEG